MRILIVGADGQLGSDLDRTLSGRAEVVGATHADLDVENEEAVGALVASVRPDVAVNCAAYNRVDDCERDFGRALSVNTIGARNVALACERAGTRVLHVSTDYVFGGSRSRPWSEDDLPSPVNAYGVSKLAGELAVRAACPRAWVARVCGLFGVRGSRGKGGNFVETMLRLGAEGRPLRVVDDQLLAPTATADLAPKLVELIQAEPPAGVYHVTAAGQCSWFDFAVEIFRREGMAVDIQPQSSSELASAARRPSYSVLANDALARLGIAQIRPWQEGLAQYLVERQRARV